MIYLQLFWSFLQIGLFSFGGGYAAIRIHSRIFIVVLVGTAFITIPTALFKLDLVKTNFMLITSFR